MTDPDFTAIPQTGEQEHSSNVFVPDDVEGVMYESYFSSQASEAIAMSKRHQAETGVVNQDSYTRPKELEEYLFNASANVKILYSKFSMHFSDDLKNKLYKQIDLINDAEDWEEGEKATEIDSFITFLRWYYLNRPEVLPNFGQTSTGALTSYWLASENKDRLVLEFHSKDHINWYVSKQFGQDFEHVSGSTTLMRIQEVLQPYHPHEWFLPSE